MLIELIERGEIETYHQLKERIATLHFAGTGRKGAKGIDESRDEDDELLDCPQLPSASPAWRFPRRLKRRVLRMMEDAGWKGDPGSFLVVLIAFCDRLLRQRPDSIPFEVYLSHCTTAVIQCRSWLCQTMH